MTTISQADSDIVKKDWIVNKVYRNSGKLQDSIDTALASYEENMETSKFFASLEEYREIIDKLCGLPEAQAHQRLLRLLVDTLAKKNSLVLEYNSRLCRYREQQAMLAGLEDDIAHAVGRISDVTDPSLPSIVSFLGTLHDQMKTDIIHQLTLANRAYAFYTLDQNYRVFPDVFTGQDFTDPNVLGAIDATILGACLQRLRIKMDESLSSHYTDPEVFPHGGDSATGFCVRLRDTAMLNGLKAGNECSFRLSRDPREKGAVAIPAWTEAADIRLTGVRVFLQGARLTGDGDTITIAITHGFSDGLYSVTDQYTCFTHDTQARYLVVYRPSHDKSGILADGTISCDVVSHSDSQRKFYAGVGPFTCWTIDIPATANPGLDLSDLSEVEIQFRGYLRPLEHYMVQADPNQLQAIIDNDLQRHEECNSMNTILPPPITSDAQRFVEQLNTSPATISALHLAIQAALHTADPDVAMSQWFEKCGFATSLDTVLDALAESLASDLRVWQGEYTLQDALGNQHRLAIIADGKVMVDGKPVGAYQFAKQTLTWSSSSEPTAGTLQFEPISDGEATGYLPTALAAKGNLTWAAGTAPVAVTGRTPFLHKQAQPRANANSLAPFNGVYKVMAFKEGLSVYDVPDFSMQLDDANKGSLSFGLPIDIKTVTRPDNDHLVWTDDSATASSGDLLFYHENQKNAFHGTITLTKTGIKETVRVYGRISEGEPWKPEPVWTDVGVPLLTNGLTVLGFVLAGLGGAAGGATAFLLPKIWKGALKPALQKLGILKKKHEPLEGVEQELKEITAGLKEHLSATSLKLSEMVNQGALSKMIPYTKDQLEQYQDFAKKMEEFDSKMLKEAENKISEAEKGLSNKEEKIKNHKESLNKAREELTKIADKKVSEKYTDEIKSNELKKAMEDMTNKEKELEEQEKQKKRLEDEKKKQQEEWDKAKKKQEQWVSTQKILEKHFK